VNKKEVEILTERVEKDFLPFVRKPGRYIGGEINQTKKDLSRCNLKVALCFPDVYEVAMSYTGLMIIYDILNRINEVVAERVFAPWIDAEQILRKKKIPLFSLESKASLKSFDVVGFSLTNELCCSNVLNMLDLGRINIRSNLRTESEPLVVAGGIISNCCEPISEFIDLFVLGEGEEAIVELVELIKSGKDASITKQEILIESAEKFNWVYVPRFYRFDYDRKKIKSFQANLPGLPLQFKNTIIKDFENAPVPLHPIVPFVQAVHERISIEIMRGCPGRCRFCQASFCRRPAKPNSRRTGLWPVRYRSVEKIVELAKACCKSTGFDTVSLLSLSSADYPNIEELTTSLQEYFQDKHVGLSVPSLRVDQQLKLLPKLLTTVRKSGLTIAVEAASEKLRDIINKPLKDEDLFAAVEAAYRAGWQKLKLYFIVGLPGETLEDAKKIVELSYQLAKLRKKVDGKTGQINITISWLVPKPHTPFGWLGQKPKTYFEQARQLIISEKSRVKAKFLHFKFHNINRSILEAVIGRGNRRCADVIEAAWQAGARFDLWDECFNYEIWQKAFENIGADIEQTAQRQFDTDEVLPWEHLGGPDKRYLLNHLEQVNKIVKKTQ
jgi:radical SAM family uncharacterized protein